MDRQPQDKKDGCGPICEQLLLQGSLAHRNTREAVSGPLAGRPMATLQNALRHQGLETLSEAQPVPLLPSS